MNKMTNDLLFSIPENADYATDPTDLDFDDIPEERVLGVKDLLRNTDDSQVHFFSAKLLTSWGYEDGFNAINALINDPKKIEGFIAHRIYGYDDTYSYVLQSLTGYFSNMSDNGNAVVAREKIFSPILHIISRSNTMSFHIFSIFWLIENKKFIEYIPALKEHLKAIIDYPEIHGWKIYDVIQLLLKFDPEFINTLLKEKGKTVDDFDYRISRNP